eukprot:659504_1
MQHFTQNMITYATLNECMKINSIMDATSATKHFIMNESTQIIFNGCMNGKEMLNVNTANQHFIQTLDASDILGQYMKSTNVKKRSKRKYKCKKCNGSFYSKDGLSNHIKQMHNEEQKQWTCRYCDMVFSRKKDLKKHKLVHNTQKPYSCYICKKRFKTLSSRNKHKKTCSK